MAVEDCSEIALAQRVLAKDACDLIHVVVLFHQLLVDIEVNEAEFVKLVQGELQAAVSQLFDFISVGLHWGHHVLENLGYVERSFTDFVAKGHLVEFFVVESWHDGLSLNFINDFYLLEGFGHGQLGVDDFLLDLNLLNWLSLFDWLNLFDWLHLNNLVRDEDVNPDFVAELGAVAGLHSEESGVATWFLRSSEANLPGVFGLRGNNLG